MADDDRNKSTQVHVMAGDEDQDGSFLLTREWDDRRI